MVFQQNSRSEVRLTNGDGKVTGAVTSEPVAQCQNYVAEPAPKCFTQNQDGDVLQGDVLQGDVLQGDVAPAMGTNANASGRNTAKVHEGATVRRLTPPECEKLQGFCPGHTLVPYNGKMAADGPRYKAIGNSMAVPVMAWIGRRIQLVDELK
jgi:DNA (cytosine-5)-methyltransferase 1